MLETKTNRTGNRSDILRLIREDVRPIIKGFCVWQYGLTKSCNGCPYSHGEEPSCIFTDCPDSWDVYED